MKRKLLAMKVEVTFVILNRKFKLTPTINEKAACIVTDK